MFQRFFYGRNGTDALNMALAVACLGLMLLSRFMFQWLFSSLAYGVMFLCFFRMISRNIPKRQQENAQFLKLFGRLRTKHARSKDKNFLYLKCPQCKQQIRIPKGIGNVKITCSKCKHVFQAKV
ncbi:MAG: hypothetical protein FWE08_05515 [Oscillospiraceae bacterium]|nr:hypothetical protein [Oscillospiraceae bacterium]